MKALIGPYLSERRLYLSDGETTHIDIMPNGSGFEIAEGESDTSEEVPVDYARYLKELDNTELKIMP